MGAKRASTKILAVGLVLALAALLPWRPAYGRVQDLTVDCDAGERLQAAIDQARPGDTVLVSGVCAENVVIPDEAARITLDGQGAATINGPSTAASSITVFGRGITIKGFTITGGTNGIAVWRGASAVIDSNTIEGGTRAGTGGQGINVAQHSYAQIVSNTIQFNSSAGITVIEGSYARIGVVIPTTAQGNVIRNNGASGGVYVSRSSGARIGANTISDNAGPGVLVDGASHAVVSGNRIDGNGSHGVAVTQNSSVWFGGDLGVLAAPNDTAAPNQGAGISCSVNSSAIGRLATLTGTAGAGNFDGSCTDGLSP
jgi:parallel beta-helix repeat protein